MDLVWRCHPWSDYSRSWGCSRGRCHSGRICAGRVARLHGGRLAGLHWVLHLILRHNSGRWQTQADPDHCGKNNHNRNRKEARFHGPRLLLGKTGPPSQAGTIRRQIQPLVLEVSPVEREFNYVERRKQYRVHTQLGVSNLIRLLRTRDQILK